MDFFREHFLNINRIGRMALVSVKEEFRGAKFGILWEVLRTAIFFTIYGAFFILIRGGSKNMHEMLTHILWLFAALLPWQLISSSINQTPRAYRDNKILVTTIKFPTSIIPTFDLLGKFIIHLVPFILLMIVFGVTGSMNLGYFKLLYYYFALFILLWSLMSFLSIICSVSVDAYKLWQVVTRIFIYLNPIFWSLGTAYAIVEQHPQFWWVIHILKLNPFVYIFEGFRDVLVSPQNAPPITLLYTAYFWVSTLVLLGIGLLFQKKIRKLLPDIL